MHVAVVPVGAEDKPALWAELQDYIREMVAYDPKIAPVNGVYEYEYFEPYWQEADRWPFWAIVEGKHAGFALVRREENGMTDMAEFYIRPDHRRGGVGLQFARALLERFPGTWYLSEFRSNVTAIAFWHRVIEGLEYRERPYISENGNERLEQVVTVPAV